MFLEALNFNQLHCTLLVLEFHCIRVIRFIRHCTVFDFGAKKKEELGWGILNVTSFSFPICGSCTILQRTFSFRRRSEIAQSRVFPFTIQARKMLISAWLLSRSVAVDGVAFANTFQIIV